MQMPGVRDKCMKLSQGKSPGKEPLSRQLLYLATLRASPAMQSVQRGGSFNFLSSPSPPFSVEFHLQAAKTSMIFCWAYFPLRLHFPFAYRGRFFFMEKKFSMPTESSSSEMAPRVVFLPKTFSNQAGRLGGVARGSSLCTVNIPAAHIQVLNSFFYHLKKR